MLAVGIEVRHLYYLDASSFSSDILQNFQNVNFSQYTTDFALQLPNSSKLCNAVSNNDKSLWHSRLGHPSSIILQHFPFSYSPKSDEFCTICPMAK